MQTLVHKNALTCNGQLTTTTGKLASVGYRGQAMVLMHISKALMMGVPTREIVILEGASLHPSGVARIGTRWFTKWDMFFALVMSRTELTETTTWTLQDAPVMENTII